jgi:hypothetical protein
MVLVFPMGLLLSELWIKVELKQIGRQSRRRPVQFDGNASDIQV